MMFFASIPAIHDFLFPNLSTLIAHVIACSIILFFVIKWAWKPFKKSQKERSDYISENILKAENSKIIAKQYEEKTNKYLEESKIESAKLIENAKAEIQLYKSEQIAKVDDEVTFLKEEAQKQIETDKIKMIENSRQKIVDISFVLADKNNIKMLVMINNALKNKLCGLFNVLKIA